MTVIWSAMRLISLSLCEIMIEVMPCALNSSRRSRSAWLSFSDSDAVGSSRMSSLTSLASALAISTSCCLPVPMLVISVSGSSRRPTLRSSSAERRRTLFQSMMPLLACSLPRNMFSAIDSMRHQREFLVDDDDAFLLAVMDAGETALLALVADVAVVAAVRIDAGQHLHQRRLAGAVLADDGVDVAALDHQVDVLQRLDARKRLGDVAHLQNGVSHRSARPSSS